MTHAAHPSLAPSATAERDFRAVAWDGIAAGFIGYVVVALLVGVLDVVQGRSFFFTAALLGQWIFYGLADPSKVVVWPGAVFAYNGLHLLGCLAVGMCGAWLAYMAEKGTQLWYLGFVLFLLVVLHGYAGLLLMTEGLRGVLPAWEVVIPMLIGIIAMTVYLVGARPALRAAIGSDDD